MKEGAQALMRKSHQAQDDAQLLLDHDRAEAVVTRAYYAAFDAARAACSPKMKRPLRMLA